MVEVLGKIKGEVMSKKKKVILTGEFDAKVWAKEFMKVVKVVDENDMVGWFANAIMAGYDRAKQEREDY